MTHYLSLACFLFLICAPGCYPRHPAQYGYVQDMGDAKTMTHWGLQQVDYDRISDAFSAILSLLPSENPSERRAALEGMVAIQNKLLLGWDGFTGFNRYAAESPSRLVSEEKKQWWLERLIRYNYLFVSGSYQTARLRVPAAKPLYVEFFLRTKPPESSPDRLKAWHEAYSELVSEDYQTPEVTSQSSPAP